MPDTRACTATLKAAEQSGHAKKVLEKTVLEPPGANGSIPRLFMKHNVFMCEAAGMCAVATLPELQNEGRTDQGLLVCLGSRSQNHGPS